MNIEEQQTRKGQEAKLAVHASKEQIPTTLHSLIHKSFLKSIHSKDNSNTFHIAISGGSLPSFLTNLPQSFIDANIDPQWDKWHIVLADERCVPSTHEDSNLNSIQRNFLEHVVPSIPNHQIYGINEKLFIGNESKSDSDLEQVDAIASDYQSRVFDKLLSQQNTNANTNANTNTNANSKLKEFPIDCALLGFGPDGHTCSLFPHHPLVTEHNDKHNHLLLVAGIHNSPKLPPKRITLTLQALNHYTRDVIFVGAGESKSPILDSIFHSIVRDDTRLPSSLFCNNNNNNNNDNDNDNDNGNNEIRTYNVILKNENSIIYPCGMIRPKSNSLHYIVDDKATSTLFLPAKKSYTCAML